MALLDLSLPGRMTPLQLELLSMLALTLLSEVEPGPPSARDEPRLWIAVLRPCLILRQLCSWIPNPVCSLWIDFPQNTCPYCLLSLGFCLLWHCFLNVGLNSPPSCSSLISVSCPWMWRQSVRVWVPPWDSFYFRSVLWWRMEERREP